MRAMGYLDGVAYTVEADADTTPDEERGIVTSASPLDILAEVATLDGTEVVVAVPGHVVTVNLTTYQGILAGLREVSEVHVVTGADTGDASEGDQKVYAEPILH